ncbi:MAG: hypothetical protein HND48_03105 [Chloroflexi bacterium]|nr:hypothetical protein [Chloroflexota bacterium]
MNISSSAASLGLSSRLVSVYGQQAALHLHAEHAGRHHLFGRQVDELLDVIGELAGGYRRGDRPVDHRARGLSARLRDPDQLDGRLRVTDLLQRTIPVRAQAHRIPHHHSRGQR